MKIKIENQRYAFYITFLLAITGIPVAWLAHEIMQNIVITIMLLVLYPTALMIIFMLKLEIVE